jgi:hypothetical protein
MTDEKPQQLNDLYQHAHARGDAFYSKSDTMVNSL